MRALRVSEPRVVHVATAARTKRALVRRLVAAAALSSLVPGCAQIITRSSVEVLPRPDTAALVVGPPGGEITARGVRAGWSQDGDRLTVHLEESRTCNSVRHVPVIRVERVDRRTAGGAMWLEYGLGGAAFAGGLVGLIRPEWFSQATVIDAQGNVLRDTRTGYRIGGILTGIGALLLTAAVVDTVRTRDEVRYADAYRREEGGVVQCMDPLAPIEGKTVELLVGKWSTVEPTDDAGGARFLLPAVEELPEAAKQVIAATEAWEAAKAEAEVAARKAAQDEAARKATDEAAAAKKGRKRKAGAGAGKAGGAEAVGGAAAAGEKVDLAAAASGLVVPAVELGPRPEPLVVKGVLRLDDKRALAVSFVVPYTADTATGHQGQGTVEPGARGKGAPPRKGKLSLTGAGAAGDGAGAKGTSTTDGADARTSAPGEAK